MSAPPSKHGGREKEEEEVVGITHSSNNNNNNNNGHEVAPSLPATATATAADGDGYGYGDDNDNDNDDAIDDLTDLPDDLAEIQKTISGERRWRQNKQMHGIQDLLPFPFSPLIRPLAISDLESCVALENAAFPDAAHRCSRDKFVYRLTQCPELCMGVYCTVVPSKTGGWEIETLHKAHPVETDRDDGAVSVLLAHIVATLSRDDVVTDEAMDYPRDYMTAKKSSHNGNGSNGSNGSDNKPQIGHQETGRTLAIHSLAVHPKLQGVGLGKLIMKAYMQQTKNSEIADRIALICQEYLVNYYKRFGFFHLGPSKAGFGGGGWHDMVSDKFSQITPPSLYKMHNNDLSLSQIGLRSRWRRKHPVMRCDATNKYALVLVSSRRPCRQSFRQRRLRYRLTNIEPKDRHKRSVYVRSAFAKKPRFSALQRRYASECAGNKATRERTRERTGILKKGDGCMPLLGPIEYRKSWADKEPPYQPNLESSLQGEERLFFFAMTFFSSRAHPQVCISWRSHIDKVVFQGQTAS
ncbi:hypothetical protein F4859DRAFT_462141 [Xylaria cf. heliscus]|nr:hypothetical protein F4859DRAFT_462141 [Xylaria cf. heliscus]